MVAKLSIEVAIVEDRKYGCFGVIREVSSPMRNEKTRTLTRSYTMDLKKFDQESHAFLSHGREQTHLP